MDLEVTMSRRHIHGARWRRSFLTAAALVLAAQSVFALPQATGGSGTGTPARTRACSGCATEAAKKTREKLLLKIDSLRWEVENRRLSEAEREKIAREMTTTIMALESSMTETMRASVALSAVEMEAAMEAERGSPAVAMAFQTGYRTRGYLGVTFDGAMAEIGRPNNERVIRFYQYPRIALVEQSSPAERAGILAGDTLLALNGDDIREHEISFTKLLVPKALIIMRVSRDGTQKDVKVVVGETPEYYVRRMTPVPRMAPATPMPPSPERVRVFGEMRPAPATPPTPPMIWTFDGLAGARLETITEGLGKAIGVNGGVLVIRVAPGTPAYRAGLRDGDVVRMAHGQNVASAADLRRVVAALEGDEGIKLVIVRERKQRELTLRW